MKLSVAFLGLSLAGAGLGAPLFTDSLPTRQVADLGVVALQTLAKGCRSNVFSALPGLQKYCDDNLLTYRQ